jgi:hypothetical protein
MTIVKPFVDAVVVENVIAIAPSDLAFLLVKSGVALEKKSKYREDYEYLPVLTDN